MTTFTPKIDSTFISLWCVDRFVVDLTESVVLITGAASGMGRTMAIEFADKGADVVGVDLDEEGVEETANIIETDGGSAIGVVGDVSDRNSVDAFIDTATDEFGTIDVLCNNAGILDDYAPLGETPESQWDSVIAVNLKGVYNCTKAALPELLDGEEGVVINTASIAGKIAGGGGAAYTTSKHGVIGFTKQLAYDYGPDIRTNAICPGFIETGMTEDIIKETPDETEKMVGETPAGRYAQPEEVARVARFLATDEASFMHGSTVDVDGGTLVGSLLG
jgi:3-oxoacyl-[acyl-carrier protein] reductase